MLGDDDVDDDDDHDDDDYDYDYDERYLSTNLILYSTNMMIIVKKYGCWFLFRVQRLLFQSPTLQYQISVELIPNYCRSKVV